jgi:hypothetical protein
MHHIPLVHFPATRITTMLDNIALIHCIYVGHYPMPGVGLTCIIGALQLMHDPAVCESSHTSAYCETTALLKFIK